MQLCSYFSNGQACETSQDERHDESTWNSSLFVFPNYETVGIPSGSIDMAFTLILLTTTHCFVHAKLIQSTVTAALHCFILSICWCCAFPTN